MIGTTDRVLSAVTAVVGTENGRRVFIAKETDGFTVLVGSYGHIDLTYDSVRKDIDCDERIFTEDQVEAVRRAIDAVVAPVDETYLDALPSDTLVRVVTVHSYSLREGGRPLETSSVYQKFGGNHWVLLDPSDRYDGEETFETKVLFAAARQYRMPGDGDPGRIEVLYVPDGNDE